MRTFVIAAPGKEDSNTRRRALPNVEANPRSNGSPKNRPYVEVRVFSSTSTLLGLIRSRQLSCMRLPLPVCVIDPARSAPYGLHFGIQFDDQLLVDRQGQLRTSREGAHPASKRLFVHFQPFRHPAPLRQLKRFLDTRDLTAGLTDLDLISRIHQIRGNRHPTLIDEKVTMAH